MIPADEPGARRLARPASGGRTVAASDAPNFAVGAGSIGEGISLHRLLVDSVRDYAIFALDATGHVLSWNEGARRIKGYAPEEIIGQHFSRFYGQEDLAAGKPAWELEVATRDGRIEDEGWRLRKDGSRFWANVVITALRDSNGHLVGFAKVTRDLTERRRAEESLRASEERFRLIVQSVRDYGIFMLDPKGIITSWNEGARRIKGYEAYEIIGRHFSTFYTEPDLASGKPAWELDVAAKEGRFEDEGWRLRKDGTRFWANVVITALRNDAGRLIGFAKVSRDLTERVASQERAIADARRIAEIESANRAKSEFLAAMSHELRTPLNAIAGFADLIAAEVAGPVSEQQREYLARIRASQQHLLAIINDLLNYSRIEAGQLTYDIASVNVHDIVDRVLPLLEPVAVTKGITVTHGPCGEGPTARADRTKAEQIVLNLLSNAVKFTPAGGSIGVACIAENERVGIIVTDTGPGIPADQQSAIFEPFVQLGRSLSSTHEGIGLGLAISRDMARAMSGDVTVESVEGEGSTFRFMLPRASASEPRR